MFDDDFGYEPYEDDLTVWEERMVFEDISLEMEWEAGAEAEAERDLDFELDE